MLIRLTFKLITYAPWISKSCHPRRYVSAQNGFSSRKGNVCAVVLGGDVWDYCAKKISNGVCKRTSVRKTLFISGINT